MGDADRGGVAVGQPPHDVESEGQLGEVERPEVREFVRRHFRDMFGDLEREHPHLKENLLSAMGNLDPSRLLDPRFLEIDGGSELVSPVDNDESPELVRLNH